MKEKKAIKKDILDKFRELDAEQDMELPENWLFDDYYNSLDSYEQKAFKQAVKELVSQGLVTQLTKTRNLKLTEKGANLIH